MIMKTRDEFKFALRTGGKVKKANKVIGPLFVRNWMRTSFAVRTNRERLGTQLQGG